MNREQTFQQFLATQRTQLSIPDFLINLLIAAVLAIILSWIYCKSARSISNRERFANNFISITLTTMFIITVVKSSLALSLGLVGALSIVRFRTAIKEPEELSYLFLCIAIGLGLGAGQRTITILAFVIITALVILKSRFKKPSETQNLYLTITSYDSKKLRLENIIEIVKKHCSVVDMKRFDDVKGSLEASFLIAADDFKVLQNMKDELEKLSDSVGISFLDNTKDM